MSPPWVSVWAHSELLVRSSFSLGLSYVSKLNSQSVSISKCNQIVVLFSLLQQCAYYCIYHCYFEEPTQWSCLNLGTTLLPGTVLHQPPLGKIYTYLYDLLLNKYINFKYMCHKIADVKKYMQACIRCWSMQNKLLNNVQL